MAFPQILDMLTTGSVPAKMRDVCIGVVTDKPSLRRCKMPCAIEFTG
jgi:hypothetical protein